MVSRLNSEFVLQPSTGEKDLSYYQEDVFAEYNGQSHLSSYLYYQQFHIKRSCLLILKIQFICKLIKSANCHLQ